MLVRVALLVATVGVLVGCLPETVPSPSPAQAALAPCDLAAPDDSGNLGSPDAAASEGPTLHRFCLNLRLEPSPGWEQIVQVLVLADQPSAPLTGRSVLVFHPGGPGLSVVEAVNESPPDVDYSRYVVLTWDGVTAGSGVGACGGETIRFLTERTSTNFAELADVAGRECEGGFGSNRDIGAWQAADELEVIRTTLGLPRLDFVGISYGTAIGEAYLWTHPSQVRRAVLDAPLALEVSWHERVTSVGDILRVRADALAAACDLSECQEVLEGLDQDAAYEALREAVLDRAPAVGSGSVTLTPIMFDQAAMLALRSESYLAGFSQAVGEALAGDGSALWRVGERTYLDLDRQAFYWSICADILHPSRAAEFVPANTDPLTFAFASELAPCAVLPRGEPRPQAQASSGSEPDVLVVASTADVIAPSSMLDSSPFLQAIGRSCTTDVAGHTSFADPTIRASLIEFIEDGDVATALCGE